MAAALGRALRLGISCLLLLGGASIAGQSGDARELAHLKRATVFIYQVTSLEDNIVVTCVSTGTLISADGLILTNAHGVVPSRLCDGDSLIVALTVDLAEPPIPKYRAEIISADPGLDIAVIQIARELDGRLIAGDARPPLPFASIGDSDTVSIDDNLVFVGHPDLGNQPIGVARGTVTAMLSEPVGGGRAWYKTRAEIPGTMAGGGAYNADGELIGIPTNAPLGTIGGSMNCRFIDDSNRDGLINSADHCVPTGDFINTIRPVNLAQSLIRGAQLGLRVDVGADGASVAPTSPPRVSRLFFSPSVQDRLPSTVVGSLPANTSSVYLFFDYDNMTPETVYELRVTRDGSPDTIFSLPPVRWSGSENGLWHIGGREQAWANGAYEFDILIDGTSAGSQRIVIGGAATSSSHFSDIVFGTLDRNGALVGNGSIVPVGNIASARFLFANMPFGTPWSAIWYFRGAEVARTSGEWTDGASGSKSISLAPTNGLLPGGYRLELYIKGALSATSDFTVAGVAGTPLPVIFHNLRFAAASPALAGLAQAAASFPSDVPALYALFDWQSIAVGTPWEMRWRVDDQVFYAATNPWLAAPGGSDYSASLVDPADGTYALELLINNLKIAEAVAVVGIGQLPIDRFAEAEGTVLSGQVLDAATKSGVASVTIVLIGEDYAASEFEWRADQIFDFAITDRNGDFQFGRPLASDTPYSIVIEADGYLPLAADGFEFAADERERELVIELVRG